MNDQKKPYYITTAIAYTSKKPHIGNTYEAVLTDAVARYRRLKGETVFFLTGTDEHGQKVEDLAREKGLSPKEYVDTVAAEIRGIWDLMETSYDGFIRTTDEQHERIVQKIFKKLYEQGDIYKGKYEGWYCKPCESFFTETQIDSGVCPDCGAAVEKAEEEAYFFRMSKYQDRLMKHIEDNPDFIVPESRKREMVNNFLKPGLQDLCVSRTSFSWGVPVDFDKKHVVYVWIDALSNYITAIGYDPDGSTPQFNELWPADVHVIGKDILRFHTIYWPIMLMALDLPLPKQIFGHPWMLFGKDKMSKSKGNVIYADTLAKRFSVDCTRYYMLCEMPYGQDGGISYETVVARYNSDLANTLGNLVNRTIAMCHKYFNGSVENKGCFTDLDKELILACKNATTVFCEKMDTLKLADAVDAVMELARRANKYIDETAPWTLSKDESNDDRLSQVLYNLIETIRYLGVLLTPIIPSTASRIFEQTRCEDKTILSLLEFGKSSMVSVGAPEPLFARLDEAKVLAEISAELEASNAATTNQANLSKASQAPVKSTAVEGTTIIGIEDFQKVKLIVAKVVSCEKVEKSDKLYQITLEDGEASSRQIVSGIAAWYQPCDLIGKKVIVVSNLKPAKLRGVESNGMLLAADCPDGSARVIFVDDIVPTGARIR